MSPLVSVCIPVYNAEPYIAETLQSVLQQTYTNWELIIVENCSTDGSAAVITRGVAEADDRRVQVHTNEQHLDMAGNMNHALGLARGEFIKLLCADDTITSNCLERQVQALEQHPEAVIAGCSRNITAPDGKILLVRSSFPKTDLYPGRQVVERCLRGGTNLIGEPTSVLLRASALQGMSKLDPEARYWIDFELWSRLLLQGDMYFDKEPLAQFRLHGGAATRTFERATVTDFLAIADRISQATGTKLSGLQRVWVHLKIRMLHIARRFLYRRFATAA